jgi:hypothetical protein
MITMGSEGLDRSGCTGTFNQLRYGVTQLCALALPESDTRQIQTQSFLLLIGDRIEEANALDETTIATIAGIRYNHVVKRTILGTATGKTNDDHKKPI